MIVTVLGSGTSAGVPMIGCACPVCRSSDARNRRTRASIWVEQRGRHFVVDTTPDFRAQVLREGVPRVDGVLWTHAHADHINGIDDLRAFNFLQRDAIQGWANPETAAYLKRAFAYIWATDVQVGGGKPALDLRAIPDDPSAFRPYDLPIVPLPVKHGRLDVTGYRFGPFAYITDTNHIPDETLARLEGLDVLILSALRPEPHPTHFNFAESIEIVRRVRPGRAYFTHLNHEVDHAREGADLPDGITLAFDGLKIELPDA